MARRLTNLYTQLLTRPYRVALRYIDTSGPKEVVEVYRYSSYGDLVTGLLTVLAGEDSAFLRKISKLDDNRFMASPHKTRRYVAQLREHLFINSPHLTEKYSRKVHDHWVVTNIGRIEARAIVSAAAAATGAKGRPLSELQF